MNNKKVFRNGDYVLTPCQNAFNGKISYWISKKDHTIALYAFTPMDEQDLEKHTSEDAWNGYIQYFENTLTRIRG